MALGLARCWLGGHLYVWIAASKVACPPQNSLAEKSETGIVIEAGSIPPTRGLAIRHKCCNCKGLERLPRACACVRDRVREAITASAILLGWTLSGVGVGSRSYRPLTTRGTSEGGRGASPEPCETE